MFHKTRFVCLIWSLLRLSLFITGVAITMSPRYGNELGGDVISIQGPCFREGDVIACRFADVEVPGVVVNPLLAQCVAPQLGRTGRVKFELFLDGESKGVAEYTSCKCGGVCVWGGVEVCVCGGVEVCVCVCGWEVCGCVCGWEVCVCVCGGEVCGCVCGEGWRCVCVCVWRGGVCVCVCVCGEGWRCVTVHTYVTMVSSALFVSTYVYIQYWC